MRYAFLLDAAKKPLDPCPPPLARTLLDAGQAAVFRHEPFTLILREPNPELLPQHTYRIKLDPGSRVSGIALLCEETGQVVWAGELTHRGQQIKDALESRASLRRGRRNRKTRYRPARFDNRTGRRGKLPPSVQHRIDTTLTWVDRLCRYAPVVAISMEDVKFDMQKLVDPEISGIEYQQGTLYGYEVKEYLLEKYRHKCVYCGAKDVPLEVEHLIPRSRGGSDRPSNLALACRPCNQKKGSQTAAEFGFPDLMKDAQKPLKDAAAANSVRKHLYEALLTRGLPVETGTGGLTKYNRMRRGLKKAHWIDAACIGESTPENLILGEITPLLIKAMGHGKRQMCKTDKFGFPIAHRARKKSHGGWQTGDVVIANVKKGKNPGAHKGRLTAGATMGYVVKVPNGPTLHVGKTNLVRLLQNDGYAYSES